MTQGVFMVTTRMTFLSKDVRNGDVLSDFVGYCLAHPEQRFWQALRNWAGVNFVYVASQPLASDIQDTYYREGK